MLLSMNIVHVRNIVADWLHILLAFFFFFFFFFLLKYGWPVSTVIFHFHHINVRSMLGDHGQLVIKKILKSGAELAS